jgi:putative toxin-antitoxin system antitoxin component (TIGR02293 family)
MIGGDDLMSLAYADEAIHIRQLAPLTARDIARATGAGQSTVEAWLARTRAPSGTRAERLLELAAIVEQAARVLRPEAIPVWLNKPVPSLEQHKPIELIARGEYRRVADVLAGLETAMFS